MEKFAEKILRSSAKIGFEAYVNCLKTKQLLKVKLKMYLDNLEEVHIDNSKMCKTIQELQNKVDDFVDAEWERDVYKEVKYFLWPLNPDICITFTILETACRDYQFYHNIMVNNVQQGVQTLDWLEDNNCKLSKRKCTKELMLIFIHFFRNSVAKIENTYITADVTFPKGKIFDEFQKAFSIDANYMEPIRFWREKYPKYVLKCE